MRLFIAVGYPAKTAAPELVYLGRDGTAYEAACKAAPFPLIEKFPNPVGIRKNNGAAAANAAAEEAALAAELASERALLQATIDDAVAERLAALRAESAAALAAADTAHREQLAALERGYTAALAERDTEVTSLRAELKAAKKKAGQPSADPAAP